MGKIGCTCGHVISDVAQPNPNEGVLLSTFNGEGSDAEEAILEGSQIWECDECGTLILAMPEGKLRHYKAPDGTPVGLFKFPDTKR